MKTVFSPLHSLRSVKTELDGGILIEPHEKPSRAETILARVTSQTLGERIAQLGLPTVFTMEGGCDVDAIGVNVVNVMQGFESEKQENSRRPV